MDTTNTKRHFKRALATTLVAVFAFLPYGGSAVHAVATDQEVADLNQQIDNQRKTLQDLEAQKAALQQAVDSAAGNVHDINSQIALIDAQIAQSNHAIREKQEEITALELEMTSIQQSIDRKTAEINTKKSQLANAIRQMDSNTRISTLALVITQENLSEFYSQAQAVTALSRNLKDTIDEVETLKSDLTAKQDALVKSRDDQRQAKLQLEVQRNAVVDQRSFKDTLLSDAKKTQDQYEDQLAQAAKEEQQANATISALEQQVQRKLNGGGDEYPDFTSTGYIWPVKGPLTAYFHDPSYPFRRYIGEHTGLDIGVPQGTPVKAAADGVVSVVHSQGWVTDAAGKKIRSALNFVGVVHEKGIATRYLHLSAVYVHTDQFVRQGDIIGLSGGLPGTAGAGTTTTGAHLHLEFRVDGIPDDPLKYLP